MKKLLLSTAVLLCASSAFAIQKGEGFKVGIGGSAVGSFAPSVNAEYLKPLDTQISGLPVTLGVGMGVGYYGDSAEYSGVTYKYSYIPVTANVFGYVSPLQGNENFYIGGGLSAIKVFASTSVSGVGSSSNYSASSSLYIGPSLVFGYQGAISPTMDYFVEFGGLVGLGGFSGGLKAGVRL